MRLDIQTEAESFMESALAVFHAIEHLPIVDMSHGCPPPTISRSLSECVAIASAWWLSTCLLASAGAIRFFFVDTQSGFLQLNSAACFRSKDCDSYPLAFEN